MLKIGVILSSLKNSLDWLHLWTDRLSRKTAIGLPSNLSDSVYRKALNSSVLIDLGWIAEASNPRSKLIADISAYVLTLRAWSKTVMFP